MVRVPNLDEDPSSLPHTHRAVRSARVPRPERGIHVAAFRSDGFDDEFKLILSDPETGGFEAPTQADGC